MTHLYMLGLSLSKESTTRSPMSRQFAPAVRKDILVREFETQFSNTFPSGAGQGGCGTSNDMNSNFCPSRPLRSSLHLS